MKSLTDKQKHVFFKVACSLVLCGALMCDMLMVGKILAEENPWTDKAGLLLGGSIILLGVYELLFFGYREVVSKSKYHYIHFLYAAICFAAGILSCAISKYYHLLGIVGTIYLCVPLLKRILSMIKNHSVRKMLLGILIGIVLVIFIISTAMTIGTEEISAFLISGVMPSIIIALTCLVYICSLALSNFNNNVLRKIIRKTYAGEVLFGLLILIVAFSMVIMMVEPGINSFLDAIWYCFMLITTIGFGDMTAVTTVGRVLSIFLGLYGIVVVAIVTSVIVNFYNEVKGEKDDEDVEEEKQIEGSAATDDKSQEENGDAQETSEQTAEEEQPAEEAVKDEK